MIRTKSIADADDDGRVASDSAADLSYRFMNSQSQSPEFRFKGIKLLFKFENSKISARHHANLRFANVYFQLSLSTNGFCPKMWDKATYDVKGG